MFPIGKRVYFHVQTSSNEEKIDFYFFCVLYSMDICWYRILDFFLPKFFMDAHYNTIYWAVCPERQRFTFSNLSKPQSGKNHILPIFMCYYPCIFYYRITKKIAKIFMDVCYDLNNGFRFSWGENMHFQVQTSSHNARKLDFIDFLDLYSMDFQ